MRTSLKLCIRAKIRNSLEYFLKYFHGFVKFVADPTIFPGSDSLILTAKTVEIPKNDQFLKGLVDSFNKSLHLLNTVLKICVIVHISGIKFEVELKTK